MQASLQGCLKASNALRGRDVITIESLGGRRLERRVGYTVMRTCGLKLMSAVNFPVASLPLLVGISYPPTATTLYLRPYFASAALSDFTTAWPSTS